MEKIAKEYASKLIACYFNEFSLDDCIGVQCQTHNPFEMACFRIDQFVLGICIFHQGICIDLAYHVSRINEFNSWMYKCI